MESQDFKIKNLGQESQELHRAAGTQQAEIDRLSRETKAQQRELERLNQESSRLSQGLRTQLTLSERIGKELESTYQRSVRGIAKLYKAQTTHKHALSAIFEIFKRQVNARKKKGHACTCLIDTPLKRKDQATGEVILDLKERVEQLQENQRDTAELVEELLINYQTTNRELRQEVDECRLREQEDENTIKKLVKLRFTIAQFAHQSQQVGYGEGNMCTV